VITSDKTLDLIEELRAKGESFCVATILRTADSTSARAGAKAVVTKDGDLYGFVGGGCVTGAVRRAALVAIEGGGPQMIRIKPKDQVVSQVDLDGVKLHKSSCPSGGTVDVFLEPMRAPRSLVICGASPIAQAILAVAAGLGLRSVVAAAAEDHEKMPGAQVYMDGFDFSGLQLTEKDAAIVATQGKRDRDALRAVLLGATGYKGMVCSRKKLAKLTEELVGEDGRFTARFETLHAPAGLDIGAIEPEEIALAVVAEIVAERRKTATAIEDVVITGAPGA